MLGQTLRTDKDFFVAVAQGCCFPEELLLFVSKHTPARRLCFLVRLRPPIASSAHI
jgi:hypothetical protein